MKLPFYFSRILPTITNVYFDNNKMSDKTNYLANAYVHPFYANYKHTKNLFTKILYSTFTCMINALDYSAH